MSTFLGGLLAEVSEGRAQLFSAVGTLNAASGAAGLRTEARQRRRVRRTQRRREAKTVDEVLERWQHMRLKELGFKTIIEGHVCSMGTCEASGSIQLIDDDLNLYGCIKSGVFHVCEASISQSCKETYTTTEGDILCIFSKKAVSRSADSTLYGEQLMGHDSSKTLETGPVVRVSVAARRARNSARVAETSSLDWASGGYGEGSAAAAAAQVVRHREQRDAAETSTRQLHVLTEIDRALVYDDAVELPPEAIQAGVEAPRKRYRHGMLIDSTKNVDYKPLLAAKTTVAQAIRRVGSSASAAETYVAIDGTDDIETIGQGAPTVLALAAAEEHRKTLAPCSSSTATTPSGSGGLQLALSSTQLTSGVNARIHADYLNASTPTDIETIISTLFRPSFRNSLVREYNKEVQDATRASHVRYIRQCHSASVRPCLHALIQLRQTHLDRTPNLACSRGISTELLKSYTAVAYLLWIMSTRSSNYQQHHTQFRLVDHVVVVLYMLKDKLSIASASGGEPVVVFENDGFLNDHLPDYQVIRTWSVPLTRGLHTVSRVLTKTAMRKKYLDLSKTNISNGQAALMKVLQEHTSDRDSTNLADSLFYAFDTGVVDL